MSEVEGVRRSASHPGRFTIE